MYAIDMDTLWVYFALVLSNAAQSLRIKTG